MVNELRANGYKSTSSCKVIADGILSQKGATPEKVKASFEKRRDATPEEKEEYEKQAKAYKENRDKRRKEKETTQQTPQT
jgi:vacuolar-type H+-ATPase subunit I/STV1